MVSRWRVSRLCRSSVVISGSPRKVFFDPPSPFDEGTVWKWPGDTPRHPPPPYSHSATSRLKEFGVPQIRWLRFRGPRRRGGSSKGLKNSPKLTPSAVHNAPRVCRAAAVLPRSTRLTKAGSNPAACASRSWVSRARLMRRSRKRAPTAR